MDILLYTDHDLSTAYLLVNIKQTLSNFHFIYSISLWLFALILVSLETQTNDRWLIGNKNGENANAAT